MTTPKENYDQWLAAKDVVKNQMMDVSIKNKSGDCDDAIRQFSGGLEFLIEKTRIIFEQDAKRIAVRNDTISSLQDDIADLQATIKRMAQQR